MFGLASRFGETASGDQRALSFFLEISRELGVTIRAVVGYEEWSQIVPR